MVDWCVERSTRPDAVGSATQRDGEWKRSRSRPDHIRTPWRERWPGLLRREGYAVLTVVGAGALNQAIKALAITLDHVAGAGIDLVCIPSFTEVDIDGDRAHCDPAARGGSQPWRRGDRDRTTSSTFEPTSARSPIRASTTRSPKRLIRPWGVGGLIDA